MKKTVRPFLVVCSIVMNLIPACALFEEEFGPSGIHVAVEIPELPGLWRDPVPGQTGFEFSVTIRDGVRTEASPVLIDGTRSDAAAAFSFTAPSQAVVTVTAVPVIRYGGLRFELLPAGAVYPYDAPEKGRLVLTWSGGFSASFLERLAARSFPLRRFNVPRFLECVLRAGEADPWLLEDDDLLSSVLSGTMTASGIRKRASFTVALDLPEGLWLEDNVLRGPVAAKDGYILLERAVPGMRTLFRADAPGVMRVYVDAAKKAIVRKLL